MTDVSITNSTLAEAETPRISSKLIESVTVRIEAFLGSASMTVADLTGLTANAVVPLEEGLNQAVELRLNGIVVARGELVAVDEKFGVRLTEISKWPA
ncbi:FliM/FliN family flagellar motor switch protein [Sphingomonas elodea]|uniref:FliM/FliN family flagellar motor switch protein n=1 Tax=Sphingomonas elodea TaxID=179878 RepID=UPI001300C472|nr:FliM/FliN family flagellar motor switch protein [Sphingomonas elodea]